MQQSPGMRVRGYSAVRLGDARLRVGELRLGGRSVARRVGRWSVALSDHRLSRRRRGSRRLGLGLGLGLGGRAGLLGVPVDPQCDNDECAGHRDRDARESRVARLTSRDVVLWLKAETVSDVRLLCWPEGEECTDSEKPGTE